MMFKGMPKVFWVGLLLTYGWVFVFMMLEWNIPGFPLRMFLGIPACYIYNALMTCYVIVIFVAWLYAYSEEKREAKLEKKS